MKYLGMTITMKKADTVAAAMKNVDKIVRAVGWRFKIANTEVH